MDRIAPSLFLLCIFALIITLMWVGWKNRQKRQSDLPQPESFEGELTGPGYEGMYVVTTVSGQPFERINVHGLGVRTNACIYPMDNRLVIQREGVQDLSFAPGSLTQVGTTSGMVGKFVEKDGLVVLTWKLGEQLVDTGFRPRFAEQKKQLIKDLARFIREPE